MAENILLKPGEHQKVKWLLHMIIRVIVMGAMLIALSGRWDYWQGWVFLGVNLISATLIILAFDLIDVLKERMKPGPGIKSWDKVFWGFYGLSGTATFIIPPLDIRFAWLEPVSIIVYIPAFLIFLMTLSLLIRSMMVNRFFSSVVRIQKDRGQYVVDTGPYHYVRHPGYTASLGFFISLPLILGSYLGLIPAVISIILIIIRTRLEDKTLHQELEGYTDYARRVKYRLIPGLW